MNCALTNHVNRLIFGPFRRININALIETKIEELNAQNAYFDTIINFNLERCI